MSNSKKRKRSRSHSQDRHKRGRRADKKMQEMQDQITNLTNMVRQLTEGAGKTSVSTPSHSDIPPQSKTGERKSNDIIVETMTEKEDVPSQNASASVGEQSIVCTEQTESIAKEDTNRDEIQKLLGIDSNDSKHLKINFHEELRVTWMKWMKEGLPEKKRDQILEIYSRKDEFYTEAPKVNTDIIPILTDIAKKRDKHFVDTQNCVGTAILALGAAISMMLEAPEDGIDQEKFSEHLCHVGQLLSEIFHQQSVTRKSFITPLLNKSLKPTLDTTTSDEWLYSEKFRDMVKEAKVIEKAVVGLKQPEKTHKTQAAPRSQGNWKYPPATWKQVGNYYRRPTIKFRPRNQGFKQSQRKPSARTTSHSSSKK
ncbi:uncharacterized protein [Temnothorax longispinosus]|uniref:uncharacterized protein n=1 Tax=Temnothorax longispinosus TaxID=300112 RepID=UPI003A991E84